MCPHALCCTVRPCAAVVGSHPVKAAHCALNTSHLERQCLYSQHNKCQLKTQRHLSHCCSLLLFASLCLLFPISFIILLVPFPSISLLTSFPSCSSSPQISHFSHHFSSIVPSTCISPLSTLHSAIVFYSVPIL
jgi:hypothetical protein